MKAKLYLIFGILMCLLVFTSQASAVLLGDKQSILYYFYGTDENGEGTATMELYLEGNTLEIKIDNTSPISLIEPTVGDNTPGITAFGIDLENADNLTVTSWEMTAYQNNDPSSLEIIGSSDSSDDKEWDLLSKDMLKAGKLEGVSMDYFGANEGGDSNIDGALYSPLAYVLLTSDSNTDYFTTAILTIVFNGFPGIDIGDPLDPDYNPTYNGMVPYVRMQRVGLNQEGSLKLYGDTDGGGGGFEVPVPEPSTILLLGMGLAILGWRGRKLSDQ